MELVIKNVTPQQIINYCEDQGYHIENRNHDKWMGNKLFKICNFIVNQEKYQTAQQLNLFRQDAVTEVRLLLKQHSQNNLWFARWYDYGDIQLTNYEITTINEIVQDIVNEMNKTPSVS